VRADAGGAAESQRLRRRQKSSGQHRHLDQWAFLNSHDRANPSRRCDIAATGGLIAVEPRRRYWQTNRERKRPMPREPPVIKAALPDRSVGMRISSSFIIDRIIQNRRRPAYCQAAEIYFKLRMVIRAMLRKVCGEAPPRAASLMAKTWPSQILPPLACPRRRLSLPSTFHRRSGSGESVLSVHLLRAISIQ